MKLTGNVKLINGSTERDLLLRAKAHDLVAIETLYNQYKFQSANNMLKLVKSEVLAEDLLQDVFIKVWDNRHLIDPDLSFRSYVFRIAQHMIIDLFRKAARDRKLREHILVNGSGIYSHVEELLDEKEKKLLIDKAM